MLFRSSGQTGELVIFRRNRTSDAQGVDGEISRNREYPRRNGSLPRVIHRSVLPRTRQGLLRNVFGRCRVAEHAEGESEHTTLKAADEGGGR